MNSRTNRTKIDQKKLTPLQRRYLRVIAKLVGGVVMGDDVSKLAAEGKMLAKKVEKEAKHGRP